MFAQLLLRIQQDRVKFIQIIQTNDLVDYFQNIQDRSRTITFNIPKLYYNASIRSSSLLQGDYQMSTHFLILIDLNSCLDNSLTLRVATTI